MYFSQSSIIPSEVTFKPNSSSEHNIPFDSTPLILLLDILNCLSVDGKILVPSFARTVINPSFTFGAPQTIWKISFPSVTSHNFNLSALGCLITLVTFAITKSLSCSLGF